MIYKEYLLECIKSLTYDEILPDHYAVENVLQDHLMSGIRELLENPADRGWVLRLDPAIQEIWDFMSFAEKLSAIVISLRPYLSEYGNAKLNERFINNWRTK